MTGQKPVTSLAAVLFPEANATHLLPPGADAAAGPPQDVPAFRSDDVLVYPCGGPCPALAGFPGTVLTVNGESTPLKCRIPPAPAGGRRKLLSLTKIGFLSEDGGGEADGEGGGNGEAGKIAGYFATLIAATEPPEYRRILLDARHRAGKMANTGERFLIYAAGNCVPYRQDAFDRLSRIGQVYHGGPCRGNGNAGPPPIEDGAARGGGFTTNALHFRRYRFVLALENESTAGYISEKILSAFLAGSVPIYYGSAGDVFEVFNRRAFVFYDVSDPRPALDLVEHLEANRTAYLEMLREPVLANGEETIARYFSFHDGEPGAGRLKWAIRERIGFG
jgi:hypothetical protein